MAAITNSEIVESINRVSTKRNLYRFTLDNGEVHERRSWVPVATDNAADLAAVGGRLLDELARAEIKALLGGSNG